MNTTNKIISATSKYIRIAPNKVDVILKKLRGKSANNKRSMSIIKLFEGSVIFN